MDPLTRPQTHKFQKRNIFEPASLLSTGRDPQRSSQQPHGGYLGTFSSSKTSHNNILTMSHLSPEETNLHRSLSAASVAASDTTYHSFLDTERYGPAPAQAVVQVKSPMWKDHDAFQPATMQRQDSGYESIPSGSKSGGSHDSGRRISTTSSSSSHRSRTRPSIRRATRSTPNPHTGLAALHSPNRPRSQQRSYSYFQFPNPELTLGGDEHSHPVQPLHPPPPQTTHYWTSDHTRRLEYAAIDSASKGVKGWVLKHVVPDCFVPKENRRLDFDDDTGSVRRYRLELDCDDSTGKPCGRGKKMGWLLGR
jgi:hypothetical protein